MRYFIDLSYNGTNFHGWQVQPNAVTVQSLLNGCLSTLLKEEINCVGAGRTDTGVHAKQMIAHFDCEKTFSSKNLVSKLNAFLPKDIAIRSIRKVQSKAHARFDAKKRTYVYKICSSKNVFEYDKSYFFKNKLDLGLMNEACLIMMNYSNFESFSRTNSHVKTFICYLSEASWTEAKDFIYFKISADRFLRNMVRAIVGTMIDVGIKKTTLLEFDRIIQSKDRTKAGASAPSRGLYLTQIDYNNSIFKDV